MNQTESKEDQIQTECVEDLQLTNQQAEEAKAGKGSATLQTYVELKLEG